MVVVMMVMMVMMMVMMMVIVIVMVMVEVLPVIYAARLRAGGSLKRTVTIASPRRADHQDAVPARASAPRLWRGPEHPTFWRIGCRDNPPVGSAGPQPPEARSVWDSELSLRGLALELVNELLDRPHHSGCVQARKKHRIGGEAALRILGLDEPDLRVIRNSQTLRIPECTPHPGRP